MFRSIHRKSSVRKIKKHQSGGKRHTKKCFSSPPRKRVDASKTDFHFISGSIWVPNLLPGSCCAKSLGATSGLGLSPRLTAGSPRRPAGQRPQEGGCERPTPQRRYLGDGVSEEQHPRPEQRAPASRSLAQRHDTDGWGRALADRISGSVGAGPFDLGGPGGGAVGKARRRLRSPWPSALGDSNPVCRPPA